MTVEQILATSNSKTWKIRKLIDMGKTRVEITNLGVLGAYGAIQNVYAAYQRDVRPVQSSSNSVAPSRSPRTLRPTAVSANVPLPIDVPVVIRNEIASSNGLKSMIGNRDLTRLTEKFGIEIEAYDTNRNDLAISLTNNHVSCVVENHNHTTRRHWKIVTDSSIRGENAFEIVSPILVGQAGLDELKKVCTVLQMSAARVNDTTGLHVHFDASSMSFIQIKNLLINYMNFEGEIDSFLSESRRDGRNNFTKSLRTLRTRIEASRTIAEMKNAYDNSRYFNINLKSLDVYKTIEFRQHSGTVEYEKISNWIIFLHNLIDYSKQYIYPARSADFEAFKRLNQRDVYDFLVTRQNQLAA